MPRAPEEVPPEFAEDYEEAAAILERSPKASAALSRRCLQHILREKAGVQGRNLKEEIEALINSSTLPSDLNESIELLRTVGNLGAHATKNANTGEVVPVEPEWAEWCLRIVESLFELYFVSPARQKQRREDIKAKIARTKKPNMP